MDETPASALQYGHLGKPIYVPDRQAWAFPRTLEQPSLITYAGVTKTSISSPFPAPRLPYSENNTPLPIIHPDLAACWPSVDEKLSRAVTATSELCDPRVSSLFDLGHAVELESDESGGGTMPIAVVATGESRDCISFRKFEEDIVELDQLRSQSSRIRVPSVGNAESTEWSAGGGPVRQICFARTVEETPTWIAARFPQSTTLFRPLYHRTRVPMHMVPGHSSVAFPKPRNSRLDANPLVEISTLQTGGFAHADVTFNPWYPKQFGLVDERGNWSIWELSARHKRHKSGWTTACIKSGSLPWVDLGDGEASDDLPRHDGWAAIEWAGDVGCFVVADRRCLMLYRMESDHVWPYSAELGLKKKSEWILDVKRSQHDVSHIFVLTTSRILWLDVGPVVSSTDEQEKLSSLAPRLSWYHFRDPEDTTLRLDPLFVNKALYLILYSRLNHFALAFQCRVLPEGQKDMMHAPDPFILDIPPASDDLVVSEVSGSDAQFSTLVFKEIAPTWGSTGRKDNRINIRLMKLFILDSNLALRESIYVAVGGIDTEENLPGPDVLRLKRRYPVVQKLARSKDDFIVDDWDESVSGMDTLMGPPPFGSAAASTAIPEWTIDFESVYAVATGRLMEQAHGQSFRKSIEELDGKISRAGLSTTSTMYDPESTDKIMADNSRLELLGRTPWLDDIDQNARDLQTLNFTATPGDSPSGVRHRLVVLPRNLPSSSSADSAESSSKPDLVGTYDSLVDDWLSSLPDKIPARTRIMKEKAVRGVAVDLALARINVARIPDAPKVPRPEEQTRNSATADDMEMSETLAEGSEEGPNLQIPRIQPYSSLASLTTFNAQSMPRSITTILSHWDPETDPAGYDWQSTVQEQESESETPRRTPRSRSRMKKSQSPGVGSSTPPATSSALPTVRFGSQPGGPDAPVKLESSQAVEEDAPMTQVERGMFGGREASRKSAMKARKKRTAGF